MFGVLPLVCLLSFYGLVDCILPWPGDSSVSVADAANEFRENLSGLYYNQGTLESTSDDFLFGVMNSPSTIFKLFWNGIYWQKYAGINQNLHYTA